MAMEQLHVHGTWRIVVVLIIFVAAGYIGLLALTKGTTALAGTVVSCPMGEEACANGGCDNHEACQNGTCNSNCPGNCPGKNGGTE